MKNPFQGSSNPSGRRGSAAGNLTTLSRTKTGSQSVRGRISGPVPIKDLSEDEIGAKEPRPGIAHSRTWSALDMGDKQSSGTRETSLASRITAQRITPSPGASDVRDRPSAIAQPTQPSRARTSEALRQSSISEVTDASSRVGFPQRKKSTFRGALQRFLGRGKQKDSRGDSKITKISESDRLGNSSTTEAALKEEGVTRGRRSPGSDKENLDTQRSGSLPISEYDRALRSHSIGPEDVMVINTVRNSLNAEALFSEARKSPNITREINPFPIRDGEPAGLSPRPVSTHGRSGSEPLDAKMYIVEDTGIGRAISNDKRRSRSVSGIYSLQSGSADNRRRSDEIRFWRDSYAVPGEPPIPASPGDLTKGVPPPKTPPQPFNFGSAVRSMKITDAVNMETRLGRLEKRMKRMEKKTSKSGESAIPRFTPELVTLQQRPYQIDEDDMSRPSTQDSDLPGLSSMGGPVSPLTPPRSGLGIRPTSTATVRGLSDLPPVEKDGIVPLRLDHYLNLMQMIESERSSRQALEAQVKTLTHHLRALSRSSADTSTILSHPPQRSSRMEVSAFDHDDTEDEEEDAEDQSRVPRSQPAFQKNVLEDSGIGRDDDDDYDEDFDNEEGKKSHSFTPSHERNHSLSAFGQDLSTDNDLRNARTLSFSQYNYENI